MRNSNFAMTALALLFGLYSVVASPVASAGAHRMHGQHQMKGQGEMPMKGQMPMKGKMPMTGQGQMSGQGMMSMMGHGMMRHGMGGHENMAPGMGPRVLPIRHLSAKDVRHFLEHRLGGIGFTRLKVGSVQENDNGTIVADIVTAEGGLVQRLEVDRHTGMIR